MEKWITIEVDMKMKFKIGLVVNRKIVGLTVSVDFMRRGCGQFQKYG